jgi:hypothetical protein
MISQEYHMLLALVVHMQAAPALFVAVADSGVCHMEDIHLHETGMLAAAAVPSDSGSEERVVLDLQAV